MVTIPYPNYVIKDTIYSDRSTFIEELSIDKRTILEIELKNNSNKITTFILMNPSSADSTLSDATINLLLEYAYYKTDTGKARFVNVYPICEGSDIQEVLKSVVNHSESMYTEVQEMNLNKIKNCIKDANRIYLATGNPIRIKEHRKVMHLLNGKEKICYGLIFKDYDRISPKHCAYHPSRKAWGLDYIEGEFLFFHYCHYWNNIKLK
ncbi:hypothetical protein A4A36_20590 [Bacillus subtilis]|uniref:DUF1643 domain-containing protein n=1 Tax=Bacillus stercoris TaxID=2054641 RepID=UPI0008FB41A5|nr:DUF1643 domain-containing protein [Bacillus stercoris]OIS63698.1 hypothetical protein A4A36_20590 [Bacillus subtilis]OIS68758.1 hypothetical protein A4A37_01650 [Bacillus subtilis]OIS73083.1 hypothetical protein A4A35_04250 [Bacillus subtilis]